MYRSEHACPEYIMSAAGEVFSRCVCQSVHAASHIAPEHMAKSVTVHVLSCTYSLVPKLGMKLATSSQLWVKPNSYVSSPTADARQIAV